MSIASTARKSIPIATLDDVQPGALTVIYGDERITLHTAMKHPEFNSKKRAIDALLMQVSKEHAAAQVAKAVS